MCVALHSDTQVTSRVTNGPMGYSFLVHRVEIWFSMVSSILPRGLNSLSRKLRGPGKLGRAAVDTGLFGVATTASEVPRRVQCTLYIVSASSTIRARSLHAATELGVSVGVDRGKWVLHSMTHL